MNKNNLKLTIAAGLTITPVVFTIIDIIRTNKEIKATEASIAQKEEHLEKLQKRIQELRDLRDTLNSDWDRRRAEGATPLELVQLSNDNLKIFLIAYNQPLE